MEVFELLYLLQFSISRSSYFDFFNGGILQVEEQVGCLGLYFSKCSASYDVWPAKSSGKL